MYELLYIIIIASFVFKGLAYEENQMGLFLKRSGNNDQTKAGEMMQILGSCMAQSGQERLGLRTPLARLHQVSIDKMKTNRVVRYNCLN